MIINRLRAANFGPFSKIDLDLDSIPDGMIAITGESGSGKSHLIEMMFSIPLTRKLLYHESYVQNHFTDEGYVHVDFTYAGKKYTSIIKGMPDKSPDCFLYENDQAIAGPGAREYDDAIRNRFPSLEFMIASRCSSQNNPMGFFGLSKEEKHSTFSSIIGTSVVDNMIESLKLGIRNNKSLLIKDSIDNNIDSKIAECEESLVRYEADLKQFAFDILQKCEQEEELESLSDELDQNRNTLSNYWNRAHSIYNEYIGNLNLYRQTNIDIDKIKLGLGGVDLDNEICSKCTLTKSVRSRIDDIHKRPDIGTIEESFSRKIKALGPIPQFDIHGLQSKIDYLHQSVNKLSSPIQDLQKRYDDTASLLKLLRSKKAAQDCSVIASISIQNHNSLIDILSESKRFIIGNINPVIAEITNDLLKYFDDGKFQIKLPTEKENKVNKQLKENFNPIIYNTWTNSKYKKVSGGEQAIIAEALRMGFYCMSAMMSGNNIGTLCRDEAIGHISSKYVSSYIDILRAGMKLGRANKVLFVCHNPKIIAAADYCIKIADGNIVKANGGVVFDENFE